MSGTKRISWTPPAVMGLAVLCSAGAARAHGLGNRYDLPVPLDLYLYGAAATVAVSFLVIALFTRSSRPLDRYPRVNLLDYKLGQILAHPTLGLVLRLVGVFFFVMVVMTGLFGEQRPTRNFAPTFVWVIWWVGFAYVSALVGNLWTLVNPWRTTFAWLEALHRRLLPGSELSLRLPYPKALGVWPSAVLFLGFTWAELVFSGASMPANVAAMVLVYSVITWTGMLLFGRECWLRHGEGFSLAFGVLARFAPTEIKVTRTQVCKHCELECLDRQGECINCYECYRRTDKNDREWALRPYGVALLRDESVSPSMMAFVLLMLSTIMFDGFMVTSFWTELATQLYSVLPDLGGNRLALIRTLGLVFFWFLFLIIYGGVCRLMSAASGGRISTWESAVSFTFTLVPIAIAYHLAHYLTYLLVKGQFIIPLLSDPFGYGWNLLGTRDSLIDVAIVGSRFAWYTDVVAIIAGHIVAVYLAHAKAVRTLPDRHAAMRSQYPMTVLMILYTVCGLWILAQPIVNSPVNAALSAKPVSSAVVNVVPDVTTSKRRS
jgi:hypothetical protein